MKPLRELTRPNIWRLKPYSSARDEYKGTALAFLDANENPYNPPYNRYPDPLQQRLKAELAKIKKIGSKCIFLGNGSDEAIDLVFRAFCKPKSDNVVAIDPTYGMYQVCAEINNVEYRKVLLDEVSFQLSADNLLAVTDKHTKLIFLCSPNNPTGNDLLRSEIIKVINGFDGLVILDEAYNDFSEAPSFLAELEQYPNLIVFQTFSKAWGSAGIRLGMAYASFEIISILNKIKYPYNINQLTQQRAIEMIRQYEEIEQWVETLKKEKVRLMTVFDELPCTEKVYPSDANFFLVRVSNAVKIYNYLVEERVIVRNRHSLSLCINCLRVTVGKRGENEKLIEALRKYGC
ncbi:Histidinol-phosphate aminotransferase [termite gut metagenome]|jgi:histidinol-phosphate aminotransferase|uniref:Histidinol-phosphate aminotransferase n=1 Tax=termite gut metagenome TaxID=433724 RepID=A0A5J4S7E9_9ZZZZ|nr:histidinol-phosphate transaminase [Mediterranea sp.]